MDTLIDKITAFAQADPGIRAVILEGSLAVGSHVDELSDYDINIFASNYEKYLADDAWMSQFGAVLVYQKEQFPFYDAIIPNRLVVYQGSPITRLARKTSSHLHVAYSLQVEQDVVRYLQYLKDKSEQLLTLSLQAPCRGAALYPARNLHAGQRLLRRPASRASSQ